MMTVVRKQRLVGIVLLALMAAGAPAAAQPALEGRMRAFTRVVAEEGIDSVAAYFPRRGTWTWVLTTHEGARRDHVGHWRFDAAQTLRAIREGGPVCGSFAHRGHAGAMGGLISEVGGFPPRPWRRVRGNRFVPPGASAGSPFFVQWRREDGRWVVSAFGDERWMRPRLLGVERNAGTRDSLPGEPLTVPIPAEGPHAGRAGWYLRDEPILFDGRVLYKYGPPRTLRPGDVERIGSLHGVGLYHEAGATGLASVLYVPAGPGFVFHAYHAEGSEPCYDPGAPADAG
jgi:hypothetical protein